MSNKILCIFFIVICLLSCSRQKTGVKKVSEKYRIEPSNLYFLVPLKVDIPINEWNFSDTQVDSLKNGAYSTFRGYFTDTTEKMYELVSLENIRKAEWGVELSLQLKKFGTAKRMHLQLFLVMLDKGNFTEKRVQLLKEVEFNGRQNINTLLAHFKQNFDLRTFRDELALNIAFFDVKYFNNLFFLFDSEEDFVKIGDREYIDANTVMDKLESIQNWNIEHFNLLITNINSIRNDIDYYNNRLLATNKNQQDELMKIRHEISKLRNELSNKLNEIDKAMNWNGYNSLELKIDSSTIVSSTKSIHFFVNNKEIVTYRNVTNIITDNKPISNHFKPSLTLEAEVSDNKIMVKIPLPLWQSNEQKESFFDKSNLKIFIRSK
jgi:hypothetical protein